MRSHPGLCTQQSLLNTSASNAARNEEKWRRLGAIQSYKHEEISIKGSSQMLKTWRLKTVFFFFFLELNHTDADGVSASM